MPGMRVMVTGATGFVGAWTARALEDAGHTVRLLVRTPAKLAGTAGALGVDTSDHVKGDITDAASVDTALDGCDAVVHCAAVVAIDPRHAAGMMETNLEGARNVLGRAVERGLDPVVHVSSFSALFEPHTGLLHADLPVAGGNEPYGRSKAAVDTYARQLQERGAPVAITYPGMVLGPPAGDQFGEAAEGVEAVVKVGVIPGWDGAGWTVVDVRDVAAVHAALLEPGRGARRYMCGGRRLDHNQLAQALGAVTGRRFLVAPVPGQVLRGMGAALDAVSRVLPLQVPLTAAAMEYYTQMPASDDGPSTRDLGVAYRPPEQTLADTVAGLHRWGRLTDRQAGAAAAGAG